jgi:hypothetical protein
MPPFLPNRPGFVKVIIAKGIQGDQSLFLGWPWSGLCWIWLNLAKFDWGLGCVSGAGVAV